MMSNQSTASNQLLDVAQRIREMRQIVGYTIAEMAEKTELSQEQYQQYDGHEHIDAVEEFRSVAHLRHQLARGRTR